MSANLEVIEERTTENRKNIELLRERTHDLTNTVISMGVSLETTNKNVESQLQTSKNLYEKIQEFNLYIKETQIRQSFFKYLCLTLPKFILKFIIVIVVAVLAVEHNNFEHIVKFFGF